MPGYITAAILYDLISCPHRVAMDLFGNPAERDPVSPFIQLLWECGTAFEREVIDMLDIPFTDLSVYAGDEKERQTLAAMTRRDPLIYGGRIAAGDLLGDPNLLRLEGVGYVAGSIKSGSGEEGPEDSSKPKKHYAVQLALYTDILERLGRSAGRRGFIWDVRGKEVIYDFKALQGVRNPRSLWDEYQECLSSARAIVARQEETLPAYSSGVCKNCHWYSTCLRRMEAANDLTLIAELGRSKRDALIERIPTISDMAAIDPNRFIQGKRTVFSGIGPDTLRKLHERAKLVSDPNGRPYLRSPIALPHADREIFFDVEVDPMRDVCYLHGFIERRGQCNTTERFAGFFANQATPEAEEQAFADAWAYIRANAPCVVYYYSKYERTQYRRLQQRYPTVCTAEEVEDLFAPATSVDLYSDVVQKATEWPTRDHSIKTLARYLGFQWRDPHPSGAASIEWFHRWVKTGDSTIKQRILEYNEDDCRATRVLLDGVRALTIAQ